jgi:REP element-mobilizing transposase RayT
MQGFDYATHCAYFVTICTKNREHLFGSVVSGNMKTNQYGDIVESIWKALPYHFYNIELDQSAIMPNHFHGIICNVGAGSPRPNLLLGQGAGIGGAETAPLHRVTLGQIIAYFKYQSSKTINVLRQMPAEPVWQRNYHDRIIRNEDELIRVRQYVQDNPANWDYDPENL